MDSKGQKAGKGPLIAEEISNTLGTSQDQYLFQPVDKFVLDDQGDVRATDVVVCIQGNVIDRSDNAGANGAVWRTDKCYTLNTIDRPAVVYPKKTGPLMANSHPGSYSGQDAYQDMFVVEKCFKQSQIVVMSERAMSMVTGERVANTLTATDYKGVQILAIDRAAFNQGENAKYDFQIDGGGYSADAHRTWSRCSLLSAACVQATTSSRNSNK